MWVCPLPKIDRTIWPWRAHQWRMLSFGFPRSPSWCARMVVLLSGSQTLVSDGEPTGFERTGDGPFFFFATSSPFFGGGVSVSSCPVVKQGSSVKTTPAGPRHQPLRSSFSMPIMVKGLCLTSRTPLFHQLQSPLFLSPSPVDPMSPVSTVTVFASPEFPVCLPTSEFSILADSKTSKILVGFGEWLPVGLFYFSVVTIVLDNSHFLRLSIRDIQSILETLSYHFQSTSQKDDQNESSWKKHCETLWLSEKHWR